jgi:hypothetical protein
VVEEIDAPVVEGIGQAVTRPINGEHAAVLRERWQDRHDLERASQPTVDVQQRRPAAELVDLCLALGPANRPGTSLGREPREQRRLCLRELPIQRGLHTGEDRRTCTAQHRWEYLSGYGFRLCARSA